MGFFMQKHILIFFLAKDKKKGKKTCLFYKKTISLQRKLS